MLHPTPTAFTFTTAEKYIPLLPWYYKAWQSRDRESRRKVRYPYLQKFDRNSESALVPFWNGTQKAKRLSSVGSGNTHLKTSTTLYSGRNFLRTKPFVK